MCSQICLPGCPQDQLHKFPQDLIQYHRPQAAWASMKTPLQWTGQVLLPCLAFQQVKEACNLLSLTITSLCWDCVQIQELLRLLSSLSDIFLPFFPLVDLAIISQWTCCNDQLTKLQVLYVFIAPQILCRCKTARCFKQWDWQGWRDTHRRLVAFNKPCCAFKITSSALNKYLPWVSRGWSVCPSCLGRSTWEYRFVKASKFSCHASDRSKRDCADCMSPKRCRPAYNLEEGDQAGNQNSEAINGPHQGLDSGMTSITNNTHNKAGGTGLRL